MSGGSAGSKRAIEDAHDAAKTTTKVARIPRHDSVHLNPLKEIFLETADRLYHLGLDSAMDLPALFGDLRFIIMCGSADRAEAIAEHLVPVVQSANIEAGDTEAKKPPVLGLGKKERYALFKVGPCLVTSHGMGAPSILILLNELVKLVEDSGLHPSQVEFVRVGTCGGLGVPPGTCVVTTDCLNSELHEGWRFVELGKAAVHSAEASASVVESLVASSTKLFAKSGQDSGMVRRGKTVTTEDFYGGQGRMDGALQPWYGAEERRAFLQRCAELGVLNIEMEAAPMLAFCRRAGVPAGCVAVTLLDRLEAHATEGGGATVADQVTATREELGEYQRRAIRVAAEHVRRRIVGAR